MGKSRGSRIEAHLDHCYWAPANIYAIYEQKSRDGSCKMPDTSAVEQTNYVPHPPPAVCGRVVASEVRFARKRLPIKAQTKVVEKIVSGSVVKFPSAIQLANLRLGNGAGKHHTAAKDHTYNLLQQGTTYDLLAGYHRKNLGSNKEPKLYHIRDWGPESALGRVTTRHLWRTLLDARWAETKDLPRRL